jgi:hypothetical protein
MAYLVAAPAPYAAFPWPWEAIGLHAEAAVSNPFVGGDCLFLWQPVQDTDVREFRLYVSQQPGQYDVTKAKVIPQPKPIPQWVTYAYSAAGIVTDGTFFAVVTAVDHARNEGEHSNAVSSICDTTPPGRVVLEIIKRWDRTLDLRMP